MTVPARPYSWPPFEPGNAAHLTHGARSARLVGERAAELVEAGDLLSIEDLKAGPCPWLQPGDVWAVHAWHRAEARVQMLAEYLERVGLEDDDGLRESVVRLLLRCEADATRCRDRLGLDPTGRARLAKDTAVAGHFAASAVSEVAAAGAAVIDAREGRSAAPPDAAADAAGDTLDEGDDEAAGDGFDKGSHQPLGGPGAGQTGSDA